ncbi:MAG: hypothetical protein A2Y25_10515 [Candidatus Melainabacteria bacterium GWF2_37_15]|nr:MAG: hypothetical protein A2Y25_10515 [Candidatus Melainabacteria bacterium GWF2_37_15]
MTTANDFNTQQNTEVETSFDSLPLETLKHGFIRKNNFYIRRGVPESHRRIADNFMIIKKIFGHPVVQSKIDEDEQILLAKYDFNLLEFSTSKQIEDEIVFLKKWSYSNNRELQQVADEIITIRAKELKYLIATKYVSITNRLYNGHKVLEKYFEDISKYFSDSF